MPASGAAAWSLPRMPTVLVGVPSLPHRPPASPPPLMATVAPTWPSPLRPPSPSCLEASTPRTQSPPRRGQGHWLVSGPGSVGAGMPCPSWLGPGCCARRAVCPGAVTSPSGLLFLLLTKGECTGWLHGLGDCWEFPGSCGWGRALYTLHQTQSIKGSRNIRL